MVDAITSISRHYAALGGSVPFAELAISAIRAVVPDDATAMCISCRVQALMFHVRAHPYSVSLYEAPTGALPEPLQRAAAIATLPLKTLKFDQNDLHRAALLMAPARGTA
jgi:hypothetical protein